MEHAITPKTQPNTANHLPLLRRVNASIRRSLVAMGLVGCCLFSTAIVSQPVYAESVKYEMDKDHLSIGFLVEHIGYMKQLGMFLEAEGSFNYDRDSKALSELTLTIQSDSVFTNHKRRDDHLKGSDFLSAREFPEITFKMTGAQATGDTTGTITGELTLIGVTKPVLLDVTLNKIGKYPFGHKKEVIGISARGSFNRSDFGMSYAVQNGFVGDEIALIIEVEAIRQE